MPTLVLHRGGHVFEGEGKENPNLVVRAGIKQFPYPNLRYGCGMGKCAKCASRSLKGGEHLAPPNWKERERLGPKLEEGYRLICQLWVNQDLELAQDDQPLQPLTSSPAVPSAGTT
ncbi:MAG: ferredoxin [Xanthobacteraceae bacterium]|nr:ferredoxin [Xanthobacteraceae bacterium]